MSSYILDTCKRFFCIHTHTSEIKSILVKHNFENLKHIKNIENIKILKIPEIIENSQKSQNLEKSRNLGKSWKILENISYVAATKIILYNQKY